MGSRAEVGSSIRSTSGCTASARAIQSLCCCPPDIPRALFFQTVFYLIPDRGVAERFFHDVIQFCLGTDAVSSGTVGDIVINTHGERIGFLENHTHSFAEQVHVHIPVNILSVQLTLPVITQPSTRSFILFRDFRRVDLPQPLGPMNAVISFSGMCILISFNAWKRAVMQVHVLD